MKKSFYDYCIENNKQILLGQWNIEKNGDLTPENVSYGSNKKVWWTCDFGHEWETTVYSRKSGTGCPYCAGRKRGQNTPTLASEFPELIKEWNALENGDLSPYDMPPGTNRKVWWRCSKGHVWQATVKSRTQGAGCPVCYNRKIVIGENDLTTTHPELIKEWNYKRNNNISPQDVVQGTPKKVWWKCSKGHEWQAAINSRTGSKSGCPICAGKQVGVGENDLATIFPEIASRWHTERNINLTPQMVTAYSNKKVWWRCTKGHEYQATVASQTERLKGCPYCTNKKVLVGYNDLASINPKIAEQWHPELNGDLTPEMVTSGSKKKVWWQCMDGHVWKAAVYARAGEMKTGCPICAGRYKRKSYEKNFLTLNFTREAKIK